MLHGLIIANADLSMFWLSNFYLFIYLLLRFAYGGVLLMTAFLKIYPIPKIRNIPIYRLAYSIAMYCNISYRNPCIVIRIVSPDSCQYTALHERHLVIGMKEEFRLIWVHKEQRSINDWGLNDMRSLTYVTREKTDILLEYLCDYERSK